MRCNEITKMAYRYYKNGDFSQAITLYKQAAELDDAKAQYNLGYLYDEGIGIDANETEAEEWYKKAAEHKFIKAYYRLGKLFYWKHYFAEKELVKEPKEVQEEYKEKAIEWFTRGAIEGDAEAQNELGIMYRDGDLVEKDYLIAKDYFEKAANQGYRDAQDHLAYLYFSGKLIEQDYKQAYFWLQKAAEQNSAYAQFGLGLMFENGLGVDPSYSKALRWYMKSARNGYYDACYKLGLFSFTGIAGKADSKIALQYWKTASSLDALSTLSSSYYNAKYCLSCMYLYGIGTDKDIEKSEILWNECREFLKQEDKDAIDELFAQVL